jgi:hypothetical protein
MTKLIKICHYGANFHSNENAILVIHGVHHWYLLIRDDL